MLKMHVFCKFFHIVWAVVGKNIEKMLKVDQKSAKTLQKPAFCLLGRCTDFPDWFPTGSRFPKSGVGICRKRCQVLARNLPNLRIWWVWGGWGLVWGCSGGFGRWFWGGWGGGLGVLGKFLVIFGIWKDGGRFLGIWRVWKDLEGFRGILKGGMISGDFYRYLTPLVSIGTVFYFSKSGNTLPCW